MRREYTTELLPEMIDLIEWHLPGRSKDTISCYQMWDHETLLYYDEEGNLDAMISYFFVDFPFDMMIVMQRNNKFYKDMWKVLRDTTQNRVKPIRIMSDPNNKVLVRKTKQYGGEWHQDELWWY
ncbi:MAG: hypothetical protein B6U76_00125 [Desulfurococcales archaeon ex4484_217_2]|nr:MAG: hypothetical protein B6U76_00125 [Desulfurococcales archaeon ex4484_217_2]